MDRKCEILNFIRDERLDVVEELHEKNNNTFISRTRLVFASGQLSFTPGQLLFILGRYSQHVGQLGRNGGLSIEKLVIVYIILALINNGSFRSHNTEKSFDQ